jgi:hypothetical protein
VFVLATVFSPSIRVSIHNGIVYENNAPPAKVRRVKDVKDEDANEFDSSKPLSYYYLNGDGDGVAPDGGDGKTCNRFVNDKVRSATVAM